MGPFFKGQVYEWGRFRNTGSYTCTKITPKSPAPPPPSPEGEGRHIDYDVNPINVNIDIGIGSGVKLSCFHSISLIDYIIWICLQGGWILMTLTLYSRAPIA